MARGWDLGPVGSCQLEVFRYSKHLAFVGRRKAILKVAANGCLDDSASKRALLTLQHISLKPEAKHFTTAQNQHTSTCG